MAAAGESAGAAAPGAGGQAPPDAAPPPPTTKADPGKISIDPPTVGVTTQDQLRGGNSVLIKGMVVGDECKGKSIRVDAFSGPAGGSRLLTYLQLKDIGHYEMLVPKSDKPVWVVALCDSNSDGMVTIGSDPQAAYAKNPITPSKDAAAVVLNMTTQPLPQDVLPPKPDPNRAPPAPAPGVPPGGAPAGGATAPAAGGTDAAAPQPAKPDSAKPAAGR